MSVQITRSLSSDGWDVIFDCPIEGRKLEYVSDRRAPTERDAKTVVLQKHSEHIAEGHRLNERKLALEQIDRAKEEVQRVEAIIVTLKKTDPRSEAEDLLLSAHEHGLEEAKKHLTYVTETNS